MTIKRVLAAAALVVLVASAVTGAMSARETGLAMPLGVGAVVVVSGSMEPALQVNDVALLRRTIDCAPGQVVAYRSDDALILHRVVAVADGLVTTQGDANNAPDAPFPCERLVGRVICTLPGLGFLVAFVKRPAVTIAIVCIASALLLLSLLPGRRKSGER